MNNEIKTKQDHRWTGTQIALAVIILICVTIGVFYFIKIQHQTSVTNNQSTTNANSASPTPSPTQQSTRDTFVPPSEAADESTSNSAIAGITTEEANKAKELISVYGNWKGNNQEPKESKTQSLQNNFIQPPKQSPNDYWTRIAQKYNIPLDSLKTQTSFDFSRDPLNISSEDDKTVTLNVVASTSVSNPDTSKTLTGTWVVTMDKSSLQGISLIPPSF